MNYLSFDTTPIEEECAQAGSVEYYQKAKKEGETLIKQLKRQFGEPPNGCSLKMKLNPHDFGNYFTVNVFFDENKDNCVEYAMKIENDFPEFWDEESIKELDKKNE